MKFSLSSKMLGVGLCLLVLFSVSVATGETKRADYDPGNLETGTEPGYLLRFSYFRYSAEGLMSPFLMTSSLMGRNFSLYADSGSGALSGDGLFGFFAGGMRTGDRSQEYFPGLLFGDAPETNPILVYLSSFRHTPAQVKTSYRSYMSSTPADASSDLVRTDHFPFTKHDASFDAKLEFESPLSISIGYRWERWERDPEYWENVNTDQHTPKIGLNARLNNWLNVGVAFSQSVRYGSNYNLIEADPQQPEEILLPKFSLADRNRSRFDFTSEFSPTEGLSLLLGCGITDDTYGNSVYNLVDGTSWQGNASLKWKPSSRLALSMDYLHEEFTTHQSAFAGSGIFETKDRLDTVSAAFDLALIPGELNFISRGSYSIAKCDYSSSILPDGGALGRFESFFRYRLSDSCSLRCGYLFESFAGGQSGMFFRDPLEGTLQGSLSPETHVVLGVVNYEF